MDHPSFLGQGWAFPPAFVKGTDSVVALSAEGDNIRENLQILFSTRVGERLLEFGYGTKLGQLAFAKIDAVLEGRIKDTVRRSILFYERRINLKKITIDLSQSRKGLVLVGIEYLINQTNDRANFVYPFHLTEGTNLNV